MRAKLERFLENYIYLSGIKKTPKAYVDEFLRNLFILSMATVILLGSGILLLLELLPISVTTEQAYLFLLLSPLPLVAAIFLLLEPYLQARKHMSGAEREMLYVMSLLTTYAANGVPPHVALERLKDYQELFPETTKIIKRIEKIKMLYVVDDLEAMEFEGRKATSSLISDLLLSSTSIERRGGDIYSVLRDKMKSIFNAVRESYKTLADKMQLIGDVILIVYGVLPLTLYTCLLYTSPSPRD